MKRDTIRPAIPDGMNCAERLLKRMADIAIALLCLLLFAPIMLACYLAVRRARSLQADAHWPLWPSLSHV